MNERGDQLEQKPVLRLERIVLNINSNAIAVEAKGKHQKAIVVTMKMQVSLQYTPLVTLILEPTTAVPLNQDLSDVVWVGGTRVTLATVVYAWQQGHSAEEILEQFPSLQLSDIHAVLAWVLRHSEAVNEYTREYEGAERNAISQLEANPSVQALRARLRARIGDGTSR
jgi:uncharacterized protein (DUF433 family)